MNDIPLNVKFSSECLRRYLMEEPDEAAEIAIAHFEDHFVLAIKYNQLKAQFDLLRANLNRKKQKSQLPLRSNQIGDFKS